MRNIFFYISKKILWKISRPVSNFFILTHKIAYEEPFGNKPLTNNIHDYDENFANSVELKNHSISKNKIFLKFPPDQDFIRNLAYTLQNVLKKTRNSYIHGYVLYSYLSDYINKFIEQNPSNSINILDIGTARGFSALCLAKALDDNNAFGKVFTFDILPNRACFFWNSQTDLTQGPLTRLQLLKPWSDLVKKYLIFFSTATFNSLKIIDIPEINFAFIDGSHFHKDVIIEVNYLLKRLNKKSIVIFDDYDEELFPGVVSACNYLSSLDKHAHFELINIQNKRKLAIFKFDSI